MLTLLADFCDKAHSVLWDHSAFLHAYAVYLDHRIHFLISLIPMLCTVHFTNKRGLSLTPSVTAKSMHKMDTCGQEDA
ncbi:hypothetical protein E2562_030548 [Oryza meyeriana var. granulata]|uniref:Uncharacterized protein n=1 Tax=Oryza meyeriana var. granulata TaxID=110450 RepID=A0A6G1D8G1_9ORYZ|nr:hypothetical protein E2562_030548 [Oryza meyeriana var. granulata]